MTETKRATILVIDDEAIIREAMIDLLEVSGHEVVTAADGRSAVAYLADMTNRVDLVFLDLKMPDMSGGAVLGELRVLRPQVPVVITSGYGREEAVRDLAGATVDFLQKPFTFHSLRDKVAQYL
jgi:two-component system response regulator FlrC